MLKKLADAIISNHNQKQIKKVETIIPSIKKKEKSFQSLSDEALKAQFREWREVLTAHPEKDETLWPEIFAGIKNASRRLCGKSFEVRGKDTAWEMVPYDVQMVGGSILHQGKIAEMKTGEGKTLVCTFAVILNALKGKGVHVVTVNDYLAQRDAEWMTPLYAFCGLSVGTIVSGKDSKERRESYNSDITYGTNNEFGFDYLRDNMAQSPDAMVQRPLYFAIVDEVDSILIDEARTPLIISAPAEDSTEKYARYASLVKELEENVHYNIDIKQKTAYLSEEGVLRVEEILGIGNIYTQAGFHEVHHIESALKAMVTMKKDQDYIVQDSKVIIIDEFTGRMMPGRRFSDGLHQALEAKEGVTIQRESKTLATITFQNYFRLYEKLGGMTGTAETEAEEFAKIYKLDTIVIPTNRGVQRMDLPDKIFKNENGKFLALADKIKEMHEHGQPVLVGTVNIDKSELLSQLLTKNDIPHEILNAKHHEREAEIITKAGAKGAVTIATNMAGRGTDIKINEEVKGLGGLAVIGTERHESRRIDNQLRGRSGRQGDPGFSQFYVAMTDQLMRRFGGDRMAAMMDRLNLPETDSVENPLLSRSIESAQKKIEGFHFDSRKHVVQYDDVVNIHREKIYAQRRKFLFAESIQADIEEYITKLSGQLIDTHAPSPEKNNTWDLQELHESVNQVYIDYGEPLKLEELETIRYKDELEESIKNYILKGWDDRKKMYPKEVWDDASRFTILKSIDELWLEHIDAMTHLRERVALSGYAQKDPLMEYKKEAFLMFSQLLRSIRQTAVSNLFRLRVQKQESPIEKALGSVI